ncbi:MAG TPA: head-tail connector protein [Kaistia sp.]|jgi:uncharacterized phage protein (predicted DNA packaging)|nr:head-tail connector protein [Kaistia sp.]
MALDLTALKQHCNILDDADNDVLTRVLAAASAHVERQLGYKLTDTEQFPEGAPADVEQAILMLAAHWFENREASIVGVTAQSVPFGFDEIIREHRSYSFG